MNYIVRFFKDIMEAFMNINIITFNLAPMEAYTDSDTAYKRYQTLKEDKDVVGSYGIISLPILDASKPGVEVDRLVMLWS